MNDNFIKLSDVLTIIIITLITLLIIKGITELLKRKKKPIAKPINTTINICLCVTAITAIGLAITTGIALTHGMYDMNIRADKIFENIQKSPVDQSSDFAKAINYQTGEMPNTLKSSFVILYRFTCPDCELTHDNITAKLNAEGKPYWFVSSRSDVGKALCNLYGISDVPAIIAYDSNGRVSAGKITTLDGDKPIVDESAWELAIRHVNS